MHWQANRTTGNENKINYYIYSDIFWLRTSK